MDDVKNETLRDAYEAPNVRGRAAARRRAALAGLQERDAGEAASTRFPTPVSFRRTAASWLPGVVNTSSAAWRSPSTATVGRRRRAAPRQQRRASGDHLASHRRAHERAVRSTPARQRRDGQLGRLRRRRRVSLCAKDGRCSAGRRRMRLELPREGSTGATLYAHDWLYPFTYPIDQLLMVHALGVAGGALMHAASIAGRDGALLVAGPSGAGKTTMSRATAALGAHVLSDERTVVRPRRGRLGRRRHAMAGRRRLRREPLGAAARPHPARAGRPRRAEPLSPARALALLYRCHFPPLWDARASERTLGQPRAPACATCPRSSFATRRAPTPRERLLARGRRRDVTRAPPRRTLIASRSPRRCCARAAPSSCPPRHEHAPADRAGRRRARRARVGRRRSPRRRRPRRRPATASSATACSTSPPAASSPAATTPACDPPLPADAIIGRVEIPPSPHALYCAVRALLR